MLRYDAVDIACITETWLQSSTPDSVIVANSTFSVFRKDRVDSPHGGVCIIVNNVSVKAVQVDIACEFNDLEIACIDIVSTQLPVRLIVGYRPPHSSDTAADDVKYTKHFVDCLMSLCNVDASIVIVGDFNFPSIDWSQLNFAVDNNRCSTLFSVFTKQFCFEQLVTEPTRVQSTGRNSSLLDLVLCNDPFIVCDINVNAPFSTSDHCVVDFKLCCPTQSAKLPAHEFRNFSDADWNGISSYLNACDWSVVFNDCCSADECAAAFYAKLNDAIATFVPLKVFKQTNSAKHRTYPLHIRKLYRAKAAAWRRYKYFKTDGLRQEFKAISSRCRKAVYAHTVKREEAIVNSGNLGKFFRYANSKFTHKSSIGPLRDEGGSKTIDPQVKAELLAKHFRSQFTCDNNTLSNMQARSTDAGISSIVFTPSLVSRVIKKLDARSSGGPDGIPPAFFKKTCLLLCQPLAFLFQILFDEGCLPPVWRQAFIASIFKKGDSTLPSNYRPISLTCCMCKLMESVIKDQLVSYLLSKGLISKQQHAFIKKHSTVTNLLESTHDWAVAMHCSHSVDTIYIDFKGAFDSVVHSKLVFKLRNLGINGCLLQWISAFLSNRTQCVVIEHCFSEWSPVLSGVPQGSVLGPILFILFIDDIAAICSGVITHKLYADDLKLYSTINSDCDRDLLQSALDRLQQWCQDWQLTINITKCHVMHFGNNNAHNIYYLNGCQIGSAEVVTDLGVDIDPVLSYDAHINKIVGKAYSRVGVLFRGFASRNVQVLKQAYVTYVRPVLEYASSVWSPHLLKHINAIERVQKQFTRRIASLSDLTYPERLAAIDLEPLEVRRLRMDLVLYYKCLNNLVALSGSEYFCQSQHNSQTRTGGNRLTRPGCSTNRFQNDFFNRCLSCWNRLPAHVINADSVFVFKRFLAQVDLSHYTKCEYF